MVTAHVSDSIEACSDASAGAQGDGAGYGGVLYEGLPHPVKCDKIRYYEDKYFTQRLKDKVAIPTLSI